MSAQSDNVRDLLVRGIAAAKTHSIQEARFYLQWVARLEDADHDDLRQAWLWLSRIGSDPKEKRECLEHALAYDPTDPEARRELKLLNGELKPADIVDPDRMSTQTMSLPLQARRFVCSQCGGRMTFTPDGNALTCAYCGRRQSLMQAIDEGALVEEQDFIVALATAKGHSKPVIAQTFKCVSCGASFVLAPATISLTCPYCASVYVVQQTESRELILPEGVVPFAVNKDQAMRALLKWFRQEGWELRGDPVPPVGVYLPVWTFDVGGELAWNCLVEESENIWLPRNGARVVYENDLLVFASHTLNATLLDELDQMLLAKLAPYDARFLADFPAETYQVTVGDASLVARSRVLAKMRGDIEAGIPGNYRDLCVSTTRLVIESYKLIFVPLWIAHYKLKGKQYTIVINGGTGALRAEKPQDGIAKWFADLLGS